MTRRVDIFNLENSTDKFAPKERDIEILGRRFVNCPSDKNFRELYNRIQWGLKKYILTIVKSNEYVDDVFSKTIEMIYFKRKSYVQSKGKFSTWIYKIALNNSLMLLRDGYDKFLSTAIDADISEVYDNELFKNCRNEIDSFNEDDDFDLVMKNGRWDRYDKRSVTFETFDASVRCMDYLPDTYKTVLVDRFINNKKLEDIASDNKINLSSVKTWLRKGLTALESEMNYRERDLVTEYKLFSEAV